MYIYHTYRYIELNSLETYNVLARTNLKMPEIKMDREIVYRKD